MLNRFSEDLVNIIKIAREEVSARRHALVDCEHILNAILKIETSLAFILLSNKNIDRQQLTIFAENRLSLLPANAESLATVPFSKGMQSVLRRCLGSVKDNQDSKLDSVDILLGIASWFRELGISSALDQLGDIETSEREHRNERESIPLHDVASKTESEFEELRSSSESRRASAFKVIQERHFDEVGIFESILNDDYPEDVRVFALCHINNISQKDDHLAALLEQIVREVDSGIIVAAFHFLGRLGPVAIPAMKRLQDHPSEFFRNEARLFVERHGNGDFSPKPS